MELTPIDELSAVNNMLGVIGEQPVNTIDESGVSEAVNALIVLRDTSRNVQSIQLECNSEDNFTLALEAVTNKVKLPTNTLFVDRAKSVINSFGVGVNDKLVSRGQYLYNKTKHTFVFEEPVDCDITFLLEFEDLPQVVRTYINIVASKIFQMQALGSETLDKELKGRVAVAWIQLNLHEINSGNYNMKDAPDYAYNTRRVKW